MAGWRAAAGKAGQGEQWEGADGRSCLVTSGPVCRGVGERSRAVGSQTLIARATGVGRAGASKPGRDLSRCSGVRGGALRWALGWARLPTPRLTASRPAPAEPARSVWGHRHLCTAAPADLYTHCSHHLLRCTQPVGLAGASLLSLPDGLPALAPRPSAHRCCSRAMINLITSPNPAGPLCCTTTTTTEAVRGHPVAACCPLLRD